MKLLEYKIAWIDDQPDSAQGFYQSINNKLGRSGFSLNVEWISQASALTAFLNSLRKDSDYDLIMVDWKLGKMVSPETTGTSVAHQIRTRNSFATIIFYSAEQRDILRQKIATERIDGVFCVNRMHFVMEAMDVIKASVKKFSDLTTMRGLFLTAVAEFDDVIRGSAIKAYQGLSATYQQPIKDQLIDGTISYLKQQVEKIESIDRSKDLIKLMQELRPSSKQLADCLISILSSSEPSTQHTTALNKFRNYETEVLVPRNDMAHLKEKQENGRRFLERGDREWDASKFDGLRNLLSDHYDNIIYINRPLIEELIEHLKATAQASPVIQAQAAAT